MKIKMKIFGLGYYLRKLEKGWQYGWYKPSFGISSLLHGGIRNSFFDAFKASVITYKSSKKRYEPNK